MKGKCYCFETKEEDQRCVQVCMLLFKYQRGGAEQYFREICLTSVAYRAMYSIVHSRLVHIVEVKQLEQGGFRKVRVCSV